MYIIVELAISADAQGSSFLSVIQYERVLFAHGSSAAIALVQVGFDFSELVEGFHFFIVDISLCTRHTVLTVSTASIPGL